jgi:hypothetical protein
MRRAAAGQCGQGGGEQPREHGGANYFLQHDFLSEKIDAAF